MPSHSSPTRFLPRRVLAVATGVVLTASVVMFPGAAAAGTSPAAPRGAEDLVTPSATNSPTEALARDLDLSVERAEELIDAQEEAFDIHQDAVAAAGHAHAGAVFDIDTGELTILVTDTAAVDSVETVGALADVVPREAAELDAAVDALDSVDPGQGVVGWYPDVESGTVVVQALEDADTTARGLAAEAGLAPEIVRVETVTDPPRTHAEVIGGDRYLLPDGGHCVIGFAALDGNDNPGFLTAGHCGSAGTSVESIPSGGTGVFAHSIFPGNDAAFVRVDDNWTLTNLVNLHNGTYQSINGSSQAPIGSTVCRAGPTTGVQCGIIQARGQTVSYPQGTVQDLTRTDLCAEPGDSGGPMFTSDQAQGLVSGGSGNCSTGGTTYYQEVNPVLATWDLTLFLG